jgi:hypothetical protein
MCRYLVAGTVPQECRNTIVSMTGPSDRIEFVASVLVDGVVFCIKCRKRPKARSASV